MADVAEQTLQIINELGLHARAATKLVQAASKFPCDVTVSKDGHEVNGKSIMGVVMLAAGEGSKLKVTLEGHDAAQAMQELDTLFESNRIFNED